MNTPPVEPAFLRLHNPYDRTFENQNGRSFFNGSALASPSAIATVSYSCMESRFHRPRGRERSSSVIWNMYLEASPARTSSRSVMYTVVPESRQVPIVRHCGSKKGE